MVENAEPRRRRFQFRLPTPFEVVLAIIAFGTLGGAIVYQLSVHEAVQRAIQRNIEFNKARASEPEK